MITSGLWGWIVRRIRRIIYLHGDPGAHCWSEIQTGLTRPHFQNTLTLTCARTLLFHGGRGGGGKAEPCANAELVARDRLKWGPSKVYKKTSLSRCISGTLDWEMCRWYILLFHDNSALHTRPQEQAWAWGHRPLGSFYRMLWCWVSWHETCGANGEGLGWPVIEFAWWGGFPSHHDAHIRSNQEWQRALFLTCKCSNGHKTKIKTSQSWNAWSQFVKTLYTNGSHVQA